MRAEGRVHVEVTDGIGHIARARPERLNALNLEVAADARFIGAGARLSAPFLELGMTVGLGLSWFLPRLVCADPRDEAMSYAKRLAVLPPYGVQTSKQLLNAGAGTGLRNHLDAEGRAQVIGSLTAAARQALASARARTTTKEG